MGSVGSIKNQTQESIKNHFKSAKGNVTAIYSDGSNEDVTDKSLYFYTNETYIDNEYESYYQYGTISYTYDNVTKSVENILLNDYHSASD